MNTVVMIITLKTVLINVKENRHIVSFSSMPSMDVEALGHKGDFKSLSFKQSVMTLACGVGFF